MNNITCANIQIPLCLVQSVSWTKKAKTYTHSGGYLSSRGYETAEISVKVGLNPAMCVSFGLDFKEMWERLTGYVTDKTLPTGNFYLATNPIYPELEFALTNINKTFLYDATGKPTTLDCDMVFSGVKASKEVSRNKALEIDSFTTMPELIISVGDKSLKVLDSFHVNSFVTTPDSISVEMSCGTDMDLVSRKGFLERLINGGKIKAGLPQGETDFYIISADLSDEQLTITGSIYPPQALKGITKTYQNTTLKEIVLDLADQAGVECKCLADGEISYYLAFGNPLQCLKDLQTASGFLISYRQGKLTVAFVPDLISGSYNLEYTEMNSDSSNEITRGCYWFDGIHKLETGTLDKTAIRIKSPFRSTDTKWSNECLKYARYMSNSVVVQRDIIENIASHSSVTVRSNDQSVDALVENYSCDWVNWVEELELHHI